MKYKCLNNIELTPNEDVSNGKYGGGLVTKGSIWKPGISNITGEDIHLDHVSGCEEFDWLEMSRQELRDNFVEV